ncbi:MAG: type IV pilus secretin PilQ [Gammaproteobacteria bacterium]
MNHQASTSFRMTIAGLLTALAMMMPGLPVAQSITEISHSVTGDGVVRVVARASEAFSVPPASFSIDEPARIIIDVAGSSALAGKTFEIGKNGVRDIKVIESNGRTRLVARLDRRQQYEVTTAADSLVLDIGAPASAAAGASPAQVPSGLAATAGPASNRLSLNFQDIEVRSVLQLLADFTGLNMVVSDTVQGNITLRLKDVHWEEALEIIMQTRGLTSRRRGNVIMVAPTEEVARREQLEAESKQKLEELEPLQSRLVRIKYARAEDLAALVKSEANRLMSPRGSVTVDERTNTLLVHDTPTSIRNIRDLVRQLDYPVRQVLVESRVVIANDEFARELGVKFGLSASDESGDKYISIGGTKPGGIETPDSGSFINSGDAAGLMVNLPSLLGGVEGGSLGLVLGKVGSALLQLELTAMQQEGRGEIVSAPRVITSDQRKAVIKQGLEIPYQESTSSGATNVTFKEAVLKLEVTPHITPDSKIIMDLEITKDNPDYTRARPGTPPPIDSRRVMTTVRIDDGETVVLGGVFEQEKQTGQDKVPVLGDIPAIGRLFRRDTNRDLKRELLVFVTPKILKQSGGR